MTQQTMTKEFLTSKGLLTHGKSMFVISGDFGTVTLNELLEEYAQQEVAKEREKSGKLVDVVEKLSKMGPTWNLFGLVDEAKQTLKEYNDKN